MGEVETTVFAGRYRAVRRLGSGGTATVFLALDLRLEREVAIKRVHGAEVTATTARRLRREARIMASLRHPHLVPIYDMVTDDDDLFLVMEYVRGETLAGVLTEAPLDWEHTRALLEPVVSALDYVHGAGVVHRDLKPSNILVGPGGVVKVADLGLATAAEITRVTPPGAILGTPAYMAPEQARPGIPTPAADIYALATIAFEALSGVLPRWGRTVMAILAQATQEPPADLREHRAGTPAAVAEALMRAMSATPQARQRTASELMRELSAGFDAAPVEETASPLPVANRLHSSPLVAQRLDSAEQHPPRGRRTLRRPARAVAIGALAIATAAVVALVAGLGAESTTRPPPNAPRSAQAAPQPTPSHTPAASATPPAAKTTGRQTLSPTATVRAFYRARGGETVRGRLASCRAAPATGVWQRPTALRPGSVLPTTDPIQARRDRRAGQHRRHHRDRDHRHPRRPRGPLHGNPTDDPARVRRLARRARRRAMRQLIAGVTPFPRISAVPTSARG